MSEPDSGNSFWEKLGRGVGAGWEKAKEASLRLGEGAVLRLDAKGARDRLDDRYRLLGRAVAERLLDRKESAVEASEAAIRSLLDEVAAARSALAEIERKIAESTKEPEGGK